MTSILAASLVHFGVSMGFGAAHGFLGPQVEVRWAHLALHGGAGLLDAPFTDLGVGPDAHLTPAFGLRYFFDEAGSGLYLAAHAAFFEFRETRPVIDFENRTRDVYGATIGWRLRDESGLFFDAGIGMAVQFLHRSGFEEHGISGHFPFDEHTVRPGWLWVTPGTFPVPDMDLAVGIEF
jgi:hypothetical protein